ncbi:SRPBCC family protein [Mucilaginibacter ginsenosidivorans]|uniref:SRPBCC domain-containing protein n=1 Tax=Mucilaginibacter ginsenosidivorans TaxID=398053 RepID=A0A5B8V033_9SPHI|nr:SRPBCC family protein [Mucilaginibacter ginsenosidivorans]QEC63971.1 SRPBCC domain-containing protein [Mucilaginibacter ginsenosidivorans]
MTNLTLKTAIEIDAPAAKVWEALTNPAIVKQYFFGTNVKTDWKKGSPIVWEGEWDGKTYQDRGEILDVDPGRSVKYNYWSSMSGTDDAPENYLDITYDLSEKDRKTLLTVTQEKIKSEEAKSHSEQNWQSVFGKMKEMVENGDV